MKADPSDRTLMLERVIKAPVAVVWGAWMNPDTLPRWWGPDGYTCRTIRIDLRQGGDWVFDMIGTDGTVFPNHHHYTLVRPRERLEYLLLRGENGPKHAEAWITFTDLGGDTKVTLGMILNSREEYEQVTAFGAVELGLQTLGKLARFVATD